MQHDLKCWPEHYAAIERGAKTCELRLNDRNYQVGDTLLLREWEPLSVSYIGPQLRVRVTHIISGGPWLSPGYVAMSIQPTDRILDTLIQMTIKRQQIREIPA